VSPDATSVTAISGSYGSLDAAVVDEQSCAFGARTSAAVFGPAGGSGTLTIATAPGCAWSFDASLFPGVTFDRPTSGTGPSTLTFTVSPSSAPRYWFRQIGLADVVIEQTIPAMNIDVPKGDAIAVQQPFAIAGWALDGNVGAPLGGGPVGIRARGIDFLHVWAYPSTGAPIFLGSTVPGAPRPDVGAAFGFNMTNCGFSLTVRTLPSGLYTIVAFAHSEISGTFTISQAVQATVSRAPPQMVIDSPKAGSTIARSFAVGGWAFDGAAASSSGIDAVHVWAYPVSGAAPLFVGAADVELFRFDVGTAFGSQFNRAGFQLSNAALPPGTYDLVAFARSTVTGTFNNAQVVRVIVP